MMKMLISPARAAERPSLLSRALSTAAPGQDTAAAEEGDPLGDYQV